MGRLARTPPTDDIVIVRRDHEAPIEIYVTRSVLVGRVRFTNTKRVVVDGAADGGEEMAFTSLDSAARYLAERAGFHSLAEEKLVKATGQEILAAGSWYLFCETRKIDPGTVANLAEVYELSREEAKKLGIEK